MFELKRLIGDNELEKVLSMLKRITQGDENFENAIVLFSSQLKKINNDDLLGIQDNGSLRNNLEYRVLKTIDAYFNKNYVESKNDWKVKKLKQNLKSALNRKSKEGLIDLIKVNSFLLHDLYSRKFGIQPAFHSLNFCNEFIDFVWLNDNSDGPEWVLVEVLKPNINLLENGLPAPDLEKALSKFNRINSFYTSEKLGRNTTFGAVNRFRFIIIGGSKDYWDINDHALWRQRFNNESFIEIRTHQVFFRCFEEYGSKPEGFWSFEENPITIPATNLEKYWNDNDFLVGWVERYKYAE